MKAAVALLGPVLLLGLVLLLGTAHAAEESCAGQCGSFEARRKCQCDSMCLFYGSCCGDFETSCPKRTRGDTFAEGEEDVTEATTTAATTVAVTTVAPATAAVTAAATSSDLPRTTDSPVHPDAASCSGRPFDAFLQLKNGSIYAFRGEYFFELDDSSILPGYPKLIQDVWGIPGPIDAAFTRINCEGKSYIFKGNQYWRFEGDTLDEEYPRDIAVGFQGVPIDVDAAFAVPSPSYRGKEKAYFFKGDKYYEYEFKHQPSHEACVQMSRSSPSVMFTHYTDLFCDTTWEDLFTELFGSSFGGHYMGPRLTSRDWRGFESPVDAAMVGRVHLSPSPTPSPRRAPKRRGSRKKKQNRRRSGHWRQLTFDDFWEFPDLFGDYYYSDVFTETTTQEHKSTPVQNVYFFKGDKYYRVNLQTKRVDTANPPYPRSIAKYWLGCKDEDPTDATKAEKK